MRLGFLLVCIAVFITAVIAWEKDDHEIFDLVSAVETSEGKGTTFYSWLGVSSTASTSEIAKAYRKLSMRLHPDKNPNVKNIDQRFARLGVVSTILRNSESRKRYDFFYKNGVPKWRGTGYYYSRFRPGLGTVTVFLILVSSIFQYIAQKINYKKDVALVERIVQDAKTAAWGAKMIPLEGQRKVKVGLGGQRFDDEGRPMPGKTVDMVVEGQNVYILDPSGYMDPVDASTVQKPSIGRTWFISLVKSSFFSALAKVQPVKEDSDQEESDISDAKGDIETEDDAASTTGSVASAASGQVKNRRPAQKKGGRRR